MAFHQQHFILFSSWQAPLFLLSPFHFPHSKVIIFHPAIAGIEQGFEFNRKTNNLDTPFGVLYG
jgi:hypothetical protein